MYSTSSSLTDGEKQRPNPCIIGDAILPQTDKKIDQKMGSGFWLFGVAPFDAAGKTAK